MRSRDAAQRLKRFEADEKVRMVRGLEQMILDFRQMSSDLERQIKAEEERTGIRDNAHFNYSTFAKSASTRRNNLEASISELCAKLEDARRDLDEVLAEIEPRGALETRDGNRAGPSPERIAGGSALAR